LLLIALLSCIFIRPFAHWLSWLIIGIFYGSFLRDLDLYRIACLVNPAFEQIVEWKQVSELMEGYEKEPTEVMDENDS